MNFAVYCIKVYIVISLIFLGFTGYAYRVNSKRKPDDPLKKDFHFAATFLTPIWPFAVVAWILIFILRAALYCIALFLFAVGLVVIRKPFILIWLNKIATKIGNKLLEANTLLIRVFFPQLKTEKK